MRNLKALNIEKLEHLARQIRVKRDILLQLSKEADELYRRGEIRKKSGGTRVLFKPCQRLKEVQRTLNRFLQRVELPDYMHGCRPGHSIVHNARPHVGKPMVLKVDVKDFFGSIRLQHVYRMFVRLGCSPDVSRLLTRLTTYKHQLPQGAPTSPAVANLVFAPVARRLYGLAKAHMGDYSDYVDDNAFSGPGHIARLKPLVYKILRQYGFRVKKEKVEASDQASDQVVTGVKVNFRIDVPRNYIEETEALIQNLRQQTGRSGQITRGQIEGRISFCRTLNPREARRLRGNLDRVSAA
jgi:RNA-directed DNA polymerase